MSDGQAVPVLMYHWVHPEPGDKLKLYGVTPEAFRWQMQHLHAAGYESAGLDDLLAHLAGRRPLGPRRVVLTFDDGYRDNVERAGPILAELGWTATIFIVTDRAGAGNVWDEHHGDPLRPLLSWDEMRRHDGGVFSFEPHSRTHPNLTEIDPARARDEILGSGRRLEDELGRRARIFAYPHGARNVFLDEVTCQAGYTGAVTDRQGRNRPGDDPFLIRRSMITSKDNLATYLFKVATGYGVHGLTQELLRDLAGMPGNREAS
jgi:peptidoglycan/xylan/chitin deacetylase (PgdA/CDA1 family)